MAITPHRATDDRALVNPTPDPIITDQNSLSSGVSVPESIPAIVAYLDLPILDAHGESVGRLVCWGGQGSAGADAEARAVTRANDLVTFDGAAGELSAIMGTNV